MTWWTWSTLCCHGRTQSSLTFNLSALSPFLQTSQVILDSTSLWIVQLLRTNLSLWSGAELIWGTNLFFCTKTIRLIYPSSIQITRTEWIWQTDGWRMETCLWFWWTQRLTIMEHMNVEFKIKEAWMLNWSEPSTWMFLLILLQVSELNSGSEPESSWFWIPEKHLGSDHLFNWF